MKNTMLPASDAPLAAALWPQSGNTTAALLRNAVLMIAGTALLALSAKINVPIPYVPMTMQTLVVLMIGAAYGSWLGTATILAYLGEGAMGLPVFAGPVGGLQVLAGPTAGYLFGFVAAAFATGWLCANGLGHSLVRVFVAMAVGHIIILACGFGWLAFGINLGMQKALLVGVLPFIAGSVVKNALATLLLVGLNRSVDRTHSA